MARRKKPTKPPQNTGKAYEDKVAEAIRSLYPHGQITTDVKLPAVITGGERQVDTLLNVNNVLTDFDAKDHKRNIGIDTVAAYKFKLDDEQISNGVMVSNSPYAVSAVNAAEHLDVRLTHLIDLSDKEIPFKLSQKTLVTDWHVKSLRFGLRHTSAREGFSIHQDLGRAVLVNEDDSQRANAYDLFRTLWNEGEIEVTQEGYWRYTLKNQKIVMADGTVGTVNEFYFDYEVATGHHSGQWEIEQAQGLYDVKKGSFTTNKDILSKALSAEEVNKWPLISKEEAEKAQFGIKISVTSQLPEAPLSNNK